jgi:hypothetical protein
MSQIAVTLKFQDPAGNPLNGGSVTLRLSVDGSTAISNGVQIAAGRTITATLDSTGAATIGLWPNAQLSPAGTVYFVDAYTKLGEPAWSGQMTF